MSEVQTFTLSQYVDELTADLNAFVESGYTRLINALEFGSHDGKLLGSTEYPFGGAIPGRYNPSDEARNHYDFHERLAVVNKEHHEIDTHSDRELYIASYLAAYVGARAQIGAEA